MPKSDHDPTLLYHAAFLLAGIYRPDASLMLPANGLPYLSVSYARGCCDPPPAQYIGLLGDVQQTASDHCAVLAADISMQSQCTDFLFCVSADQVLKPCTFFKKARSSLTLGICQLKYLISRQYAWKHLGPPEFRDS